MDTPEYFSMQGRVLIGLRNSDGTRAPARWVYDSSKLEWAMSANKDTKNESWSGARGLAATLKTSKELKVNVTLGELNTDNAALAADGNRVEVTAGSVVAENIGDVAAGEWVLLDYASVSNDALQDGTATALVNGTDYVLYPEQGAVNFLTAQTGVTADYDYAAQSIVTALDGGSPDYYIAFVGENTVDGASKKVRGEVHRINFDPGTLAFINDNIASIDLSGDAKIDPVRQADSKWGGYARVIQIDP